MLSAVLATGAAASVYAISKADPGLGYAHELRAQSQALFGFGKPLDHELNTQSYSGPAAGSVEVAGGLSVRAVSSTVGQNADMIALWPTDDNPTYAIVCNEVNSVSGSDAGRASVQRVRLSDGQVTDMVTGLISCDPSHRTAWGTIVVAEENGATGRLWEILDPLSVSGVTLNRTTGTSSDPSHVVARPALGQLSYEGVVLLDDGTSYYGDELRPSNGNPGGGIYKFVPDDAATGPIDSLADSPLVSGTVYVMRLGAGSNFGQGSNTGAGTWVPLATPSDPTTFNLATTALTAGGYTGYFRPEDMDLDPVAAANGERRMCWNNTGNDAVANWGETLCLEDQAADSATTGRRPVVEPFVIGNQHLRMPDNLDFQPGTGILYVLMDATTSAEDPGRTNDQVWACLPDGADEDTLSDGCVRVMNLRDGEAEFTGIQFLGDGRSFLIHVQHPTQEGRATPGTADELLVTGLAVH